MTTITNRVLTSCVTSPLNLSFQEYPVEVTEGNPSPWRKLSSPDVASKTVDSDTVARDHTTTERTAAAVGGKARQVAKILVVGSMSHLYSVVPVTDRAAALEWFAAFFGRSADEVVVCEAVCGVHTGKGWLSLVRPVLPDHTP
jgi:hypothetical protein